MKKIFAFILVFVAVFSTLIGCGIKQENNDTINDDGSIITPTDPATPTDTVSPITDGGNFIVNGYNEDEQYNPAINLKTVYNGTNISLLPKTVKDYISLSDESEIAKFLYNYQQSYETADGPSGITFKWKTNFSSRYILSIATDENFENTVYTTTTSTKSLTVYNLIPATYYWKIETTDHAYVSDTDCFTINESLRTINCGNVVNMRDEGGYTGEFGKIKYNLVYRTADIAKADQTAKDVIINTLKLKTEIDLRLDTKTVTIDDRIKKVDCGILQNDYIFPNFNPDRAFNSTCAKNMKKAFLLFTDTDNYPIAFHCSLGADRTGTFSFLLCGMLGVSYEDMVKDFEITSFYKGARWRSQITKNNNTYSFTENGVMQDNTGNLIAYDKMYRQMMNAYGTGDSKLSSAIENYLITVIKLTKNDIETIRSIMIENYNV